jgi:hypothetical protein
MGVAPSGQINPQHTVTYRPSYIDKYVEKIWDLRIIIANKSRTSSERIKLSMHPMYIYPFRADFPMNPKLTNAEKSPRTPERTSLCHRPKRGRFLSDPFHPPYARCTENKSYSKEVEVRTIDQTCSIRDIRAENARLKRRTKVGLLPLNTLRLSNLCPTLLF